MTSVRSEDWQLVRRIFEDALGAPADEREAFVSSAVDGHESLRQRVLALLRSHDQASGFLEARLPSAGAPAPDLSGAQLGPYRLDACVGVGGMGHVYRAHDTRLERTVAIKVLSWPGAGRAPAQERFELEARAVAALTHSNICTLYDVGVDDLPAGGGKASYLVMEFLAGETLADRLARGPLTVAESLEYAIQIARALECAHGVGIVHRDLKPGNVMLVPSGAKLLDFGLAKATAPVVAGGLAQRDGASLTAPGTIIGTVHYMAPEQLEGLEADARADLFAFGCVLYEMLTAKRPFEGRSPAGLVTAIMAAPPAPLRAHAPLVPDDVEHIVAQCLAKEPGQRWQSARDLRLALQDAATATSSSGRRRDRRGARPLPYVAAALLAVALAGGTWAAFGRSSDLPRLAVLPLEMVGSDAPGEAHLGVAIADSIISRLAVVRQIDIRPTTAVLTFADESPGPARAAALLAVDHVLTGTIVRLGSMYKVSFQLVRDDGSLAWTRAYDLVPSSLLNLQDTVAEQVAEALRPELTPVERDRLRRRFTSNAEAYDLYLRGRASLVQYSDKGMPAAIDAFERALLLDPRFGPAHSGLAMAFAWFSTRLAYESDALQWGERANREARAALALDPSSAEAVLAIASAAGTLHGGFDWPAVIDGATRALSLDPTLDLAHVVLMRAFFHMGLFDRMAAEAARSRQLDPLGNMEIARLEVAANLFGGSYARSRDQAIALLARADVPVIRNYLGLAQFYTGNGDAARKTLAAVQRGGQPDIRSQAALAGVEAALGDRVAAQRRARAIEQGPYMDHHVAASLGAAWAQLGDPSASVRWLQQAADTGFPSYPWLARDPMLDPIRGSLEFVAFLERLRTRHDRDAARYQHED